MKRIVRWFQSINFKFSAIIVVLLLFALELIGANFVIQLEDSLIRSHKEEAQAQVDFIKSTAEPYLIRMEDPEYDGEIDLQGELQSMISQFERTSTLEIELTSPDATIIATSVSTNQTTVGQRSNDPDVGQVLILEETVTRQYQAPDTQEARWKITSPIYASGDNQNIIGVVSLTSNLETVFSQMERVVWIFLQVSVIAVLLSAILANLVARGVTSPLVEMQKTTENIASGDYTDELEVYANDEIGNLAESINELSYKVSSAQESIDAERRRLDSVLTHMSDGVVATNRRGDIILSNDMALEMLDMERGEVQGHSILNVLRLEDDYTLKDLYEMEEELLLDIDTLFVQANFSVIQSETGFIRGLVCVLRDVTKQEQIERDRRQFVSNVSHELRTPLTSMKSYLEALNDGAWQDPDIAPQFLQVASDETNRMIRMIQDLLQLSRIDASTERYEYELVDLTALMNHIVSRFNIYLQSEEMADKNYTIERDFPVGAIWIEADQDRLNQVMDNIINNAIKYSPQGGVIRISLEEKDHHAHISISDEGIGMKAEELPKIFSRFYRVDKARSREMGGTGLGLAISKEVIEQHDGRIWAKSKEGVGTTFFIVLPSQEFEESEEW